MKFNRLSIIIILFSILTACNLGIDSNKKVDDSMITIGFTGNSDLLDNSSRVISADTPTISEYELYGAFTNETKTLIGTFSDLSGASVTIKKGTWDFTLKAKNSSSQYILEGSLDAVVLTDSADTLAFDLVPLTTGSGSVNFTINIPASVNVDSVLTELDGAVQTPALTVVNSKVIYSNSSLGIGNYMLSIKMLNAAGEALCTVTELVQVLPNFISSKEITLTDADFEKAPVAPSDLAVTVGNSSDNTYAKLIFTWIDNSNNETGFQIFESDGITLVGEVGGGVTSFTWDKADRGLTYRFKVRSKNKFGESSFSSTISVKTPVRLKFEDSKNSNTTYQEVVPGVIIVPPVVSHEPDWFFDGWYDDIWVGEKLDNTPCPDTNMIYNANWTKPNFNITFNKNGADGTETMATLSRQYGSQIALSANTFTNSGYTFVGWSTTPTGEVEYTDGQLITIGSADLELYAVWRYKVTYFGNGHRSGTVPFDTNLYLTNDIATVLTAGTMGNSGNIFLSWNTEADGSGTEYRPGDQITMSSSILLFAQWVPESTFISKWKTNTDGEYIELPLHYDGTYNFTVDWGDGTSDIITSRSDSTKRHTYAKAGEYTVFITGEINGWSFGYNRLSEENIIEILNWGALSFGPVEEHFKGCTNLKITATDKPDLSNTTSLARSFYDCSVLEDIPVIDTWDVSLITDMNQMFYQCRSLNIDISNWNTSNVTNMYRMFYGCRLFKSDLSKWNTTNVTDMSSMFEDCYVFVSDLSNWNTTNVTNMRSMFSDCSVFNSDLSKWNTINVIDMSYMFRNCAVFNSDLSNWDTGNVTNMSYMFDGCEVFTSELANWNTVNVTNMNYMFSDCYEFTSDLSNWNTSNVTSLRKTFAWTKKFNSELSNWDTSKVTDLYGTFDFTEAFNPSTLEWDISNVTDLGQLFRGTKLFNADISNWNTSKVTSLAETFDRAEKFNQDISGWDVSQVQYLSNTFYGTLVFNADISLWNTSNVTSMYRTFSGAKAFNRDISWWNTSKVTNMSSMFYGMDMTNIDLSIWDTSSVTDMSWMFGYSKNNKTDFTNWNTTNVTNMHSMFRGSDDFNSPTIANFDTSNVTNMNYMFLDTDLFNQDLSSWNTSKVTKMYEMFSSAAAFNQDLSSWDFSLVTDMQYFLSNSGFGSDNYNKLLIALSNQTLQSGVSFSAWGTSYTTDEAETARNKIINDFSWSISDSGRK